MEKDNISFSTTWLQPLNNGSWGKIYDKLKGATQTNAILKRVASAKLRTETKQLCGVFCGVL